MDVVHAARMMAETWAAWGTSLNCRSSMRFFSRGFTEGLFSLGGVSVKSGRLPRCVRGVASSWEKDVSKLQEE